MACTLRFKTEFFRAPPDPTVLGDHVWVGLLMLPFWHLILRYRGLYAPRRGLSRIEESRILLESSSLGTLLLVATTFFSQSGYVSRLVLLLFWALNTSGLILFRAVLRYGLGELRRQGYNARSVLIVGTGTLARAIYERFRDHPETGFHVVGFLGPSRAGLGGRTPPHLGGYELLHHVVPTMQIDQVVIALDRGDPADPIKMLYDLNDTTAAVRIAPDLLNLCTLQAGIEDFDGLPMLRLVESPLVGWSEVAKRILDITLALAVLIVTAPLMAAIAIGIRLTSPGGPALYRQERMSLDGSLFTMLKFRTMVPDAEALTGPKWADRDDPRRTPLGRWLRALNLDEFPQLWNVLRGDMSLVGPRPERPEFIQEFRKLVPGYMQRHMMRGGMTGWAQVNGCRGNTSIEKRLEYDLEYARRWSFLFDLKIIALTFIRSFRDPNAY